MILAELLTNFLPGKIKTRGEYAASGALMMVLSLLVVTSVGHFYGQSWGTALLWASLAAGCVATAYAVAYPFMSKKLADGQ